MYLSEIRLWNFRKYGSSDFDLNQPDLIVPFQEGLNVLIGENDSGKSAILDAIKLVLKTHAYEWIKPEDLDFYRNSSILRIELEFKGLETREAKNFIEWLGWVEIEETIAGKIVKKNIPVLRLIYQLEKRGERIIPSDVKAGMDRTGYPLNAEAREYLKITYLKALRDANNDLTAKKNSRLSQILQEHKLFKKKNLREGDDSFPFIREFKSLNENIERWFKDESIYEGNSSIRSEIKDKIDNFLQSFIRDEVESEFSLGKPEIRNILEKISLGITDGSNLGLGTMNRLYMAAELLHLKKDWNGLKLCMVEELEAHLHPQAQMKIIEALGKEKTNVQFILTTHSPNLASKVQLGNLILCKDNNVYPLSVPHTRLDKKDYAYLERFLDVTKSNLFFAKGVIIVEGWSEEILIPSLARLLKYDLTQKEVSIVNVGSTAYLHFAKIFLRQTEPKLSVPVSIVTDLDNRPVEGSRFEVNKAKQKMVEELKASFLNTAVMPCIAKEWTLEWCLYKSPSLSALFKKSVSEVHSGTEEFQNGRFEETKLIQKLKKERGTSPLDKVQIATVLSLKIEELSPEIKTDDVYLEYIVEAIKHACNDNQRRAYSRS